MREIDERVNLCRYELPDDWVALAGKTDWDNEQLSLKVVRQNDYWFHVKALPGSHVILFNEREEGAVAKKDVLSLAAGIAAYHSKAKSAGITAVHYTRGKYVGKPRGAKTGTVTIKKEKTIKVRPGIPG